MVLLLSYMVIFVSLLFTSFYLYVVERLPLELYMTFSSMLKFLQVHTGVSGLEANLF